MARVINYISNLSQQQEAGKSEGAVPFCTSTYQHYLENLSNKPHAKLGGTQKFQQGHFLDQTTERDYSRVRRAKG